MRKPRSPKKSGITALYERLSRDDDIVGDSNSIVHQKEMLEDFARKNGFTNFVHYTDDGWSGASFDRPAWNRLVEGVKKGDISTVIVKDLSRVGRDHLQVGFFTDVLFPEKDVHFLAICNNIDSDRSETSEFAPFLNIMNEWFVKDTSKKIRSVMRSRGTSGKVHLVGNVPYGYQRDPDDPKHWIVDPEAAAVVKRIFQMTIDGMGPTTIARVLKAEKVERPSYYLAQRHRGTCQSNCRDDRKYDWQSTTISQIIANKEYAGYTVNFKTFTRSYKDKKTKKTPVEYQSQFPNTQEAIIDEDTWALCQAIRETVKRPKDSLGPANPLTGKILCADCGKPLYNHRYSCSVPYRTRKTGEVRQSTKCEDHYTCSTYQKSLPFGKAACSPHTVRTHLLLTVILETIRSTCAYVEIHEDEFIHLVSNLAENAIESQRKLLQSRIQHHQARLVELDGLTKRIYEDNVKGRLPDAAFEQMLDGYQQERLSIAESMQSDTRELNTLVASLSNTASFVRLVHKYKAVEELTPAIINEFINKVVVHEAIGVGAERTRVIEVHLNYIGQFSPPTEQPFLTEEEQKEIAEREEKRRRKRESNRRYAARVRAEAKALTKATSEEQEHEPNDRCAV